MNYFFLQETKRKEAVTLIFTDKNNKERVGCVCTST